jgi:hypothetical protein
MEIFLPRCEVFLVLQRQSLRDVYEVLGRMRVVDELPDEKTHTFKMFLLIFNIFVENTLEKPNFYLV